MFYNCYAYTRSGERVVIDLSLPRVEAEQRCQMEAAFIEGMGDALTRYGDSWMDSGYVPRVGMHDIRTDPFQANVRRLRWLPEGDVILAI